MDRLRAYEIFMTVVNKGSFSKAADLLDTSPANVTRYINDLEAYLGCRLLNRSSRKLSLTESGEALFERCKTILAEVAETEALVSSAAIQPRGRLRINAPLSFGILHLAPLWPDFSRRYPELELDITLNDRVVDIVEEGYDLVIRISRSGSVDHAARKLASSHNILCAAPKYLKQFGFPQTPAELRDHQCITYLYSGDEWRFTDSAGKAHQVKVKGKIHTNNGDTARAMALAGAGIIWQPGFLIGPDIASGALVPLLPDYRLPDIDVLAMYPSRRHLSVKVRVLVDYLVEAFAGTPPWER
ncbi:LysR family transcriptional regulator [Rheinheimera riviphila]|uniref:LysR family transcriptional regulator n=1 Tax=Rheinheimera riviphila TaxID=1834037 RepID=A0A437QBX5_9GAMM|nr:LysR family transcriptional regulator [Rheinheimera riviphila]RVU32062.1 LysR family transcriptional regulator [Rheinheimera riviphila]